MAKRKKKFTVTVDPGAEVRKEFNAHICLFDESGLELHFANHTENNTEITITVKDIIKIPAQDMKGFTLDIIDAIIDYEKKYQNGLGLRVPDGKATESSNSDD